MNHKTSMHACRESDERVVPTKCANQEGSEEEPRASAERMEGSRSTKRNTEKTHTYRTQGRESVSQGLGGVREAARRDKKQKFTALLHHVNEELLRSSYQKLKKQAAPGVDGVTWEQYGEGLEERIKDLHDRVHRGAYRAQPSRRTYIPKADGRQRPLGKPHDALDALWVGLKRRRVNWVLDLDVRGFFDNVSHEWLVKFLEHRIADRRMIRLIQKWLKAGVSEEGEWSETTVGTPQGAVVSPLLANIYLHYVFDLWVNQWRRKTAKGDMIVVRYADDAVLGFEHRTEAEAFLEEL